MLIIITIVILLRLFRFAEQDAEAQRYAVKHLYSTLNTTEELFESSKKMDGASHVGSLEKNIGLVEVSIHYEMLSIGLAWKGTLTFMKIMWGGLLLLAIRTSLRGIKVLLSICHLVGEDLLLLRNCEAANGETNFVVSAPGKSSSCSSCG